MMQNFEVIKVFMKHEMSESLKSTLLNNQENVINLDKDDKDDEDDKEKSSSDTISISNHSVLS